MKIAGQLQYAKLRGRIVTAEREAGRASLSAFAKLYLPHHVGRPPSPMHLEIFSMLESLLEEEGPGWRWRRRAAAPRARW